MRETSDQVVQIDGHPPSEALDISRAVLCANYVREIGRSGAVALSDASVR